MKAKTTLSISEARKRIFEIADEVQKPSNYYTFTENGKPKAVLISAVEFDSLLEDLEMLSDPGLLERIQQAEEEYKRGDYVTLEQLEAGLGHVKNGVSVVRDGASHRYRASRPRRKGR